MLKHPVMRTALLCGLALGASTPALAYFDNFLTSTVVGTMTQKEAADFMTAGAKAIREAPDGTETPWNVPAARGKAAIEGKITPTASKTDKGQKCRKMKVDLVRGSAEEHWSRWFCQQPNGQWKSRPVAD
jgi:surface antigen